MIKEKSTILAIETSCDETAVAVVKRTGGSVNVLANEIASQIDVHKLTGGIVPEVAAREHVTVIRPMIEKAMEKAKVIGDKLDAIAVTIGPGLQPALSVGVTSAQTLSYAWQKPLVPVHHIEGHIYSALCAQKTSTIYKLPSTTSFPALALVVSGGHTLLIKISGHLQYEIIGSTRDDAAGEVFDKVARMLDLSYPGGPAISELAKEGNPNQYKFSRPMLNSNDSDFSFSGLKTEILYKLRDLDEKNISYNKADIAASFQQAAVETLAKKTEAATEKHQPQLLLLAGGVAANKSLRNQMKEMSKKLSIPLRIAPLELCGDNATMIALVATLAHPAGRTKDWRQVDAISRINIEEFST
jgi:N6-L-threonylcarbamoyladenine synthase